MADLTKEAVVLTGLNATDNVASAGGDTFPIGANTFLNVKNGGGGAITVTVDSKKNCDQGFDHNPAVAIPAGEDRLIGPFSNIDRWGNPTTKKGDITYSGVTSVTVAILNL